MQKVKIRILQIGKTKHDFLITAENEYLKRLRPYAEISMITLKDQGQAESESEKNTLMKKEAEAILEKVHTEDYVIVLDEHGKQMTSPEFSTFVASQKNESRDVTFIIGGVYGLHESVKKRANLILSFSKFTFTHDMIRTLLLEQVYRAFMISNKRKYHY